MKSDYRGIQVSNSKTGTDNTGGITVTTEEGSMIDADERGIQANMNASDNSGDMMIKHDGTIISEETGIILFDNEDFDNEDSYTIVPKPSEALSTTDCSHHQRPRTEKPGVTRDLLHLIEISWLSLLTDWLVPSKRGHGERDRIKTNEIEYRV